MKNKFVEFLREKGFYLVLALCIIGASAAAWATAQKTINSIDKQNTTIQISSSSQGNVNNNNESAVTVDVPQNGVKKPQTSSSSAGNSASSSVSSSSSAQPQTSQSTSKPSTSAPAAELPSYTLPLATSEIIEPYSNGELIKNKTLGVWRAHNAIDMKGNAGDKVSAVSSGVISAIGSDPLWGGYIEIKHADGIVSKYSGLVVEKTLKKGDNVRGGQTIGTLGEIPAENDKGIHLHLSMTKNGENVDPGIYLPIKKGITN